MAQINEKKIIIEKDGFYKHKQSSAQCMISLVCEIQLFQELIDDVMVYY